MITLPPMGLYNGQPVLTGEEGEYDIPVTPGQPYLCSLKGVFDSANVFFKVGPNVEGNFDTVTGGTFTNEAEFTIIPTGPTARFGVDFTGLDTSIRIILVPIKYSL